MVGWTDANHTKIGEKVEYIVDKESNIFNAHSNSSKIFQEATHLASTTIINIRHCQSPIVWLAEI